MSNQNTKYISLHEAAKLTDYSQEYISLLCRRKKIKGKKLGRNWFTTKEWINDYVNKIKESKLDATILQQAQDDNSKGDSIPVKIQEVDKIKKVDKIDVSDTDKISLNSIFSTKKLMLATIIFSIIVSGFVFAQDGIKQNLILGVSDSVSQTMQRKIVSLNNSLNNLSGSFDNVKNNSIKVVANEIIGVSSSIDLIKNKSTKFAGNKIITASNSLDVIKNESSNYTNKKIAQISDYALWLHSPAGTMEPTIKFATNEIIGISNSLDVIKNEVNKKSANEMAEISKSQNDSRNLESTPVINNITDKNNLSSNFFGGGSAGNRTPETQVSTLSSNHSGPTANLLYQINLKTSKLAQEIISLSSSLDVIKDETSKFADSKIANISDYASRFHSPVGTMEPAIILRQAQDDIILLSNSLDVIKNESVKFASRFHSPAGTMEPTGGRVAGVSTEDSDAPSQKLTFVESVEVIFNGIGTYLSEIFGKTETKIVYTSQQVAPQPSGTMEPTGQVVQDPTSQDSITNLQERVNKLEQEIKDKEVITITETLKGEKGDSGEQGLAGPIGLVGPAGEQGLIGLAGPVGPEGTGNVITIPSAPVNTSTWSGSNVFSGFGSFESLGVAYDLSAGRSLGVGGDTSLGGDSSDTLTVNATSTFNGPVNLSNSASLTTGTGQVTFGGDVDVTGNLTITGSQTYTGAASFTDNSTSAALLVNQQGTGNIVQFQDDGVDTFTIADGGLVTNIDSTILGDDIATDILTLNSQITGDLIPSATNTYNLGSATNYWNDAYINNMVVGTTNVGGTTSPSFILNNDNVTIDTEDSWLEFDRGEDGGGGALSGAKISWIAASDYFDFDYPIHLSGTGEITGPGAGGLTLNNTSGDLTISTTTSGDLALTSAGDINITSAGAINLSSGGANALTVDSSSGVLTLGAGTNEITNTDADTALLINPNGTGAVQFHTTSFYMNSTGDLVLGGRITFENAEYVSNEVDDYILFQGSGGADDTDLTFNLDGAQPIIYSATDISIGIDDDLQFIGTQTISTSAGDLTIDSFANLVIADTTVQYSSGSSTFDIYSVAGATTLTISNSDGTQVAHLDLADGSLYTGGVERLTVAGALANITGYSQTDGDFTIAGTGNVLLSTSGTITQSGTGQVSLAGNLNATNGLDVTGITNFAGGITYYVDATGNAYFNTLGSAALATLNSLSVTNNATIGGALTVTGATTFTGGLGADLDGNGYYAVDLQNIADGQSAGSGYRFDGVNDYVNAGSGASLDITEAITISAWIKPSIIYGDNKYMDIVSNGGLFQDDSLFSFGVRTTTVNNYTLYLFWRNGATLYGDEVISSLLDDGNWVHVVGIRNSANDMELFVNGVTIGTDSDNLGTGGGNFNVLIGSPGNKLYNGSIDGVRIYNRALTTAEIKQNYSGASVDYADIGADGVTMNVSSMENSGSFPYTTFDGASSTGMHVISNGSGVQIAGTADELVFTLGKRYRLTFDYVKASGSSPSVAVRDSIDGTIKTSLYEASILTDGTQSVEWVCVAGETGTISFRNGSITAEYTISNLKVEQIGAVLNLEKDGMTEDTWFDKSGNNNDGTVEGATLINREIHPKIVGGDSTTQDLTFQTTTGVGAAGADMHFLVGNNGNVEAMTILNSGYVGIGITTPTVPLHVAGQCVTGDSRLRRRRRKRKGERAKDNEEEDDDYIYDEVEIKDIQPGDEIASLNKDTGKLVYQKVKALMDMGVKEIYKLTTDSGKTIRTTGNHPYLVNSKIMQVKKLEVDQSVRIEELNRDTVIALANGEVKHNYIIPRKVKRQLYEMFRARGLQKRFAPVLFAGAIVAILEKARLKTSDLIIDIEYPGYEALIKGMIKTAFPDIHINYQSIGKNSPAHEAAYLTHTGKLDARGALLSNELAYALACVYKTQENPIKDLIGHSCDRRTVTHRVDDDSQSNKRSTVLSIDQYKKVVKGGLWKKVVNLKVGQEIAVADKDGAKALWDKIIKIERLPEERVYDIEVENTHNFIANGIVAHNTYINTNSATALTVEQDGVENDVLVVNTTAGLVSVADLTVAGTLDANGLFTLGDDGETGAIDTSIWDISSAGIGSGFTGFASTGNIAFSGGGDFSLDSSAFDVTTGGVLSGVTGLTTSGGYTQSGTDANTFSGASSFTSAGTGLSVTNDATIGGDLTVTGSTIMTGGIGLGADLDGNGYYAVDLQNIADGQSAGSGYRFDGVDDYINAGAGSSLDITDAITIEAWIYPDQTKWGGILTKTDRNNHYGPYGIHYTDANKIRVILNEGSVDFQSATSVSLNSWHYVAFTYSQANSIVKIYIDGQQDSNTVSYSTLLTVNSTYDLLMGPFFSDSSGFRFNGSIDGVKIYNRALTETEIKANYSGASVDYADIGANQTELMPNTVDRDFSAASAWANVDLNAYDETTDLTITATVAAQYATLPVASAPTTIGKRYRMTFDVANIVSTWTIKSFDGTQTIGTVSANGTDTALEWVATTTGGYRIVAASTTSSADFDNFTLTQIGAVLNLEKDGMTEATWFDKSGNNNDGAVTGATLINREIHPKIVGGDSTTQSLTFQTTTGVGTTDADMHFLVGDNGGTEALTILNSGRIGIGDASPDAKLDIDSTSTTGADFLITNTGIGTTGTVAGITADSVTTGDLLTVSGNALTSGSAIKVVSTSAGLTSGSLLSISSATTGAVATNGIVSIVATGAYTSTDNVGLLTVQANSTLTGTIQRIEGNALTSGTALSIASTSEGLTTGQLLSLDWTPGSATTSTGDLFNINIGPNGTVDNLFNITDDGTSLFAVSESNVVINRPLQVNVAGNTGISYDLNFLNTGTTQITSEGPLVISAGDSNHNENLTITTGSNSVGGDSGVAISFADPVLTDTTKAWTADEWIGGTITIIGGTGAGQVQKITDNATNTITVTDWDTTLGDPAANSIYHLAYAKGGDIIANIQNSDIVYGGFKVAGIDDGGYIFRISPDGDVEIGGNGFGGSDLVVKQNIGLTGGILTVGQLATPTNGVATCGTVASGGHDDDTYYYRVSAINDNGETLALAEFNSGACIATAGLNSVTVTWDAVSGATAYKVYGRATGAELYMATVTAPNLLFNDDAASLTPAGALPTANTTGGRIAINTTVDGTNDRRLETLDTGNPQLRLTQTDDTNYADFEVGATGNLTVTLIAADDQLILTGDLLVQGGGAEICAGGCPTTTTYNPDTTIGDLGVEGAVVAGEYRTHCAEGYVWVPGNAQFGTMPGFCVMKYEAKCASDTATTVGLITPESGATGEYDTYCNDGNVASCLGEGAAGVDACTSANDKVVVSLPDGFPIARISQTNAKTYCSNIEPGAGYHLLTDHEWMTIVYNAIWQKENWCDSQGANCDSDPMTVSRSIADGHNDNLPTHALQSSATDSEACYGTLTKDTNTACGGDASTQKRTLTLSNGEILWDVPGNVWEWTDATVREDRQPRDSSNADDDGPPDLADYNWQEYTAIDDWQLFDYIKPPSGWNSSTVDIGKIYSNADTDIVTNTRAFLRGGGWSYTSGAGVFALHLSNSPTYVNSLIGFRCAQ